MSSRQAKGTCLARAIASCIQLVGSLDITINLYYRTAELMKKLPKYIQSMFLAYGADRMEIIAKMNVPANVDAMLKYTHQNFADDKR